MEDLASLNAILGKVDIYNNNALASLTRLENGSSIDGSLTIEDNDVLVTSPV